MDTTYYQLQELSNGDFISYSKLPLAVYITSIDGMILEFNEEAASVFNLNLQDKGQKSIIPFYCDKKQRNRIINKLTSLPPDVWLKNETVTFQTEPKKNRKNFKFFSKLYRNESGPIGAISLGYIITEFEMFRDMEHLIPLGMFEIGSDQKLTYANDILCNLLGFKDSNQLTNEHISHFFHKKDDFALIYQKLKDGEVNEKITLKTKNSSWMRAKAQIVPTIHNNKLYGAKGIITDILFEEIRNKLPLGLFMVTLNSEGEEIIVRANKRFAEFHGLTSTSECENMKLTDLYPDPEAYFQVKQVMMAQFVKNKPLLNHFLTINNYQSEEKEIILNVEALRDENGQIEGRVGAIIDITGDFNRKLMELKHDFGGFLHNYTNVLVNFVTIINGVIESHGDKVINSRFNVNGKKAISEIFGHIKGLEVFLEKFYQRNAEINLIPDVDITNIQKRFAQLKKKESNNDQTRASWIRENVVDLRRMILQYSKGAFPKELIRDIFFNITEILRYTSMIIMASGLTEVKEMEEEIETFKSALDSEDIEPEQFKDINLISILERVFTDLGEFSRLKQIELKKVNWQTELTIKAAERELYIAFRNVIHNAIKYSWSKPGEKIPYVEVEPSIQQNDIRIRIENRGVAIHKEELVGNSPKIFKFSYRGVKSIDRARKGSGVGLWHARKIIRQHSGTIFITSDPINSNQLKIDYDQPFITTVIISLPFNKFKI